MAAFLANKRSTTAAGRRLSQSLKKHHAQARQIAKKEKISYPEARKRTKEVFIETIRRASRKAVDTWFRVGETKTGKGQWRRVKPKDIPKIKTLKDAKKYTYGHRVGFAKVQRSISQFHYWALVDRISRQWDLSIADARRLLTRMKQEMTMTARLHGVKRNYRVRDAAAVLEYTDRYQNVRMEFGI